MANSRKFPQNVEILWKSACKSTCISRGNPCEKLAPSKSHVENFPNPHFSHNFPTNFFTTSPPLFLPRLFHYSTDPTTTTINNIKERI